jgi:hypothetical protein
MFVSKKTIVNLSDDALHVNGNHLPDGDLSVDHLVEDLSLSKSGQFSGLLLMGGQAVEANFTFLLSDWLVSVLAFVDWAQAEADLAFAVDFNFLDDGLFLQSLCVFALEHGVHGLVTVTVLLFSVVSLLTEWVRAISLVFLSVLSVVVLAKHLSVELLTGAVWVAVVGTVVLFLVIIEETTVLLVLLLSVVFAVVSQLLVNVLTALVVLGKVLLEWIVDVALVLVFFEADGFAFVLGLLALTFGSLNHVGFDESLWVWLDALVWSHELGFLVLDHFSANSADASLPHVGNFDLNASSVCYDLESVMGGLKDDLGSVELGESDGLAVFVGSDNVDFVDVQVLFLSVDDHVSGRLTDFTGENDDVVQEANFNVLVAFSGWAGIDGKELLRGAVLGKNVFAWGEVDLHDVFIEALDGISVEVTTWCSFSLSEAGEVALEVGRTSRDWQSQSGEEFRVEVLVKGLLDGVLNVNVEEWVSFFDFGNEFQGFALVVVDEVRASQGLWVVGGLDKGVQLVNEITNLLRQLGVTDLNVNLIEAAQVVDGEVACAAEDGSFTMVLLALMEIPSIGTFFLLQLPFRFFGNSLDLNVVGSFAGLLAPVDLEFAVNLSVAAWVEEGLDVAGNLGVGGLDFTTNLEGFGVSDFGVELEVEGSSVLEGRFLKNNDFAFHGLFTLSENLSLDLKFGSDSRKRNLVYLSGGVGKCAVLVGVLVLVVLSTGMGSVIELLLLFLMFKFLVHFAFLFILVHVESLLGPLGQVVSP